MTEHRNIKLWRIVLVGVIAGLLSLVLCIRMAKILLSADTSRGADEAEDPLENVDTTKVYLTDNALRGEVTDRYGRKMISNSVYRKLELVYGLWNRSTQNETIEELIGLCEAQGATLRADTIPLASDAPVFVDSWLTVDDKSVSFTAFMEKRKWDADLSAEALWAQLKEYYEISDELDYGTARKIAGVRFNMERYEFAYANAYVFCENISEELFLLTDTNAWLLRGVRPVYDSSRVYDTLYAAHLLGRIGPIYAEEYEALAEKGYKMNEKVGKDGIEKAFEDYLRGTNGYTELRLDEEGRTVEVVSETPAVAGNNVMLTLDLALQETAEKALAEQIELMIARGIEDPEEYPTDVGGGAVVVLDVNTGEILAMASYPTFDISQYNQMYNELLADPRLPMFNRAISGIYSPGSTFKVVTSVACLEEGVIQPDTEIEDMGIYTYYQDYQPKCWIYKDFRVTHGVENVVSALRDSCNYFFYESGRILGIERLSKYASAFGLGEYTGIEVNGESKGYIASPQSKLNAVGEAWVDGDTLQAAIGQSYNMFTPLQICNCIATLVNGGTRYECHLLKYVTSAGYDAVVSASQSSVAQRLEMETETYETVLKGMSEVTENGTAAAVFSNYDVHIGGKTGSVQVAEGTANSVFVAFGPFESPEIAVAVIVEHGGSGNGIAPIALKIFKTYFALKSQTSSEAEQAVIG